MIPTKTEILDRLNQARTENPKRNEGWVLHSIAVGNTAGKLATAFNEKGHKFDVDKITKFGYIHDIGKYVGDFAIHPVNGYKYLKKLGYDPEYCEVSITHSFVNNDPFCMFSDFMQADRDKFVIDFVKKHQFTDVDRLLNLCDCMVCLEPWTIDKRMINIIARHGVCEHTAERINETYRIKEHFDDLLGYNLYDLFPEIKNNL